MLTSGVVFREQNIVLDPFDDETPHKFRAARMFIGAAAVVQQGPMQSDIIHIQAERKLMQFSDELVVLVDSSKFAASGGHCLCALSCVQTIVTDSGIDGATAKMLKKTGVKLVVVRPDNHNASATG